MWDTRAENKLLVMTSHITSHFRLGNLNINTISDHRQFQPEKYDQCLTAILSTVPLTTAIYGCVEASYKLSL